MSLSYYEGMKPVKLPDPRIDIRTQNKYLFKQPANVVTYKTFISMRIEKSLFIIAN